MRLHRWLGIRWRSDWRVVPDELRLRLRLRSVPRPGWYMLSLRHRGEQTRCYALFQGSQGRMLIHGRLRRRLVRIRPGLSELHLELHGLNGEASLPVLRLVPQPFWRVSRLLRRKLLRLHPGYDPSCLSRSLPRLWSDYNRLLARGNRHLVGYDEWIERRERPALARDLAQEQAAPPPPAPAPGAPPAPPPARGRPGRGGPGRPGGGPARARALVSRGHTATPGNFSARYSVIARVSHMASSPSRSTGTLPTGEISPSRMRKAEPCVKSSRNFSSSKGMSSVRISTQGRSDQEE